MTTVTFPQRLLSAALGALLLSTASGTAGLAQESAPPERLSPAQQEKIFPERKALLLELQREGVQNLQKAERCTQAAKNQDALRTCMKQQRRNDQALRDKHRNGMRKIFERNGIEMPVGGPAGKNKGQGNRRQGGAGQGAIGQPDS